MEISAPKPRWERRQAELWLDAVDSVALTLAAGVDVDQRRRSLEELIVGGVSLLNGIGEELAPDILTRIQLVIASAELDAAFYEPHGAERETKILAGVEHAEAAAQVALDSLTSFVPAEALPTVLGLLATAIRLGLPGRQGYLERRIALYAGDLTEALERTAAETGQGADLLVEAGVLRDAAAAAEVGSDERRYLLDQAREAAVEARDLFFSAGNGELTRLALTCAREVIAELAGEATLTEPPSALRCPSCGTEPQPGFLFCGRCGARIPDLA